MYARVAHFENEPANIDTAIERIRGVLHSEGLPAELADAKFMLLVNRESGKLLGVTLFDSEEAMRRGDEAMNAGAGAAGRRSAVEFYEVPVETLS